MAHTNTNDAYIVKDADDDEDQDIHRVHTKYCSSGDDAGGWCTKHVREMHGQRSMENDHILGHEYMVMDRVIGNPIVIILLVHFTVLWAGAAGVSCSVVRSPCEYASNEVFQCAPNTQRFCNFYTLYSWTTAQIHAPIS